jgi:transcriptional regulator with XRE-family HTH domain
LRDVRRRHGLSQRRLALRAGTSQDAISRIERGAESPTVERLGQLLLVMGERLDLGAVPAPVALEPDELATARALSVAERLRESASWNLATTKLELAVAEARRRGHPATRRRGP